MLKIENAGRYIIGGSFSGLGMPAAQGRCVSVSRNTPGSRILLCLPWSAEGLRWHPLSGIEKPGSGCPSDVKSAGHPESGFPIPLSGCSAALCAPGEAQKNPPPGVSPNTALAPGPGGRACPNPGKNRPGCCEASPLSESSIQLHIQKVKKQ